MVGINVFCCYRLKVIDFPVDLERNGPEDVGK